MNYFSKVTGSALNLAKQSISAMSGQSEVRTTPVVHDNPQQRIEALFRATCELIERLASFSDSKTAEGDRRLQQSKVKQYLKEIVYILQEEGFRWLKRNKTNPDRDIELNSETPCIDTFLQSRMVQELCNRAVLDMPRGCLPLVLTMLTALLKSIPYPLLPHMTVHKPIANLISVAVRYDAMHMSTTAAVSGKEAETFNKAEYTAYKKRIEIGLIGLLRVLWRKFSENPAILDYFTFEDRRRRASTAGSPLAVVNSSTGTPTSTMVIQTQMDVLNALVALIQKPRVALYAQEALLVALNMCDSRIERFILIHTKFIEQILDDLSTRFQLALEAANEALSAPVALYCGSSGSISAAGTAGMGTGRGPGSVPPGHTAATPGAANPSPAPRGSLSNTRASFTGGMFASQGASTTSSLLSPLTKLPSFSTGSAAKPPPAQPSGQKVLNSPSVSAAYAYAKEAFYGTPGAAGTAGQSSFDEADEAAAAAVRVSQDAKYAPMQTFLRTLRFCVAVAAALRRMAPKAAHSATHSRNAGNLPASPLVANFSGKSPGAGDSGERVCTYESMVDYYVENFLQDVLKTALQSRGEGNAVAVNILLVSMLEEMYKAEQLWASHAGSAKLASHSSSLSGRNSKSLLHLTTQFLCGSLPTAPESPVEEHSSLTISKTLFGGSPEPSAGPAAAAALSPLGQVNYTSMLLGRVGSITKVISVSSYLVIGSVLQSAPLSLALEVLLGLPSLSAPTVAASGSGVDFQPVSPKSPSSGPSSAPPSPLPMEATKSLDEALSSICNSLALVAYHTLADDLSPGQPAAPLQTPNGKVSPTPTGAYENAGVTLDLHRYTEHAACNILGRLPGKALWSLLSNDPDSSALSPALLSSLQTSAGQGVRGGVMEVLTKRLTGFLTMKFDEQVALSALLQRVVCLLSVVVLATQHSRQEFGEPDTAVQYLMQIMELLKIIEKLWKEIKTYLQRVPGHSSKVPAMRQVLQATALVEIDNSVRLSLLSETPSADSSPAAAHASLAAVDNSRVSILHRVDAASWKLVEKEPAQARSILETAVLLHELRAEVRSYVFAIRSLRGLMKNAIGVVPAHRPSVCFDPSEAPPLSPGGPEEELTDVPEEALEDDLCALALRQAMHSFGWAVPDYRGVPFNPRTAAASSQPSSYTSLLLLASSQQRGSDVSASTNRSFASSRGATPNVSTANISILTQSHLSGRRVPLMNNLDLRLEEFLAEYQVLEASLEEIVGVSSEEGG